MDVHVLGAHVHVASASEALMALARAAYGGLPPHRLADHGEPLHVALRLGPPRAAPSARTPPEVRMQSGAGFLCGVMDADNYVVMCPAQRRALVVVSPDMLAHAYHVRYELIEFAVFTLASRALGLVPLHGACLGWQGRAALLLGRSGSGKSTLALHGLLRGMTFLAEDAVFAHVPSGAVTAVANYLHVLPDADRFVRDESARRWIADAPVIRRRSGAVKHEIDLRDGRAHLAESPHELACVVFVSGEVADDPRALLRPVPQAAIASRLAADQAYAAALPSWPAFVERVVAGGAWELRRGSHPDASVDALLTLLA